MRAQEKIMDSSAITISGIAVEVRSPNPRIPLLVYPTQELLCRTHLRPQEHYESPRFKGNIFTLDEFIPWYMEDRGKKDFTYYTDWNGFNTPSTAFVPFLEGKFNPLSEEEKALLSFVKEIPQPFYLIATHIRNPGAAGIVRHELGHALWATNPSYRQAAEGIVRTYNPSRLMEHLQEVGYDQTVLVDEAHAQAIKCRPSAKELIPPKMQEDMLRTFLQFFPPEHLKEYVRGLKDEDAS